MTKTTELLTRPAPGTIVKPVYEYDEGQKEKLQALREVSLCCILGFISDSESIHFLPPLLFIFLSWYRSTPTRSIFLTVTPMRRGSVAGWIGQTQWHATCALPSGNWMMRASASKVPSNGGGSSSRSSSRPTRSRSRRQQGKCELIILPSFRDAPMCAHN